MLMDLNTQHSKDISSHQTDTQVYHSCYQNPSKAFCKHRKLILKFI